MVPLDLITMPVARNNCSFCFSVSNDNTETADPLKILPGGELEGPLGLRYVKQTE